MRHLASTCLMVSRKALPDVCLTDAGSAYAITPVDWQQHNLLQALTTVYAAHNACPCEAGAFKRRQFLG